jgi:hypothetical protein
VLHEEEEEEGASSLPDGLPKYDGYGREMGKLEKM